MPGRDPKKHLPNAALKPIHEQEPLPMLLTVFSRREPCVYLPLAEQLSLMFGLVLETLCLPGVNDP